MRASSPRSRARSAAPARSSRSPRTRSCSTRRYSSCFARPVISSDTSFASLTPWSAMALALRSFIAASTTVFLPSNAAAPSAPVSPTSLSALTRLAFSARSPHSMPVSSRSSASSLPAAASSAAAAERRAAASSGEMRSPSAAERMPPRATSISRSLSLVIWRGSAGTFAAVAEGGVPPPRPNMRSVHLASASHAGREPSARPKTSAWSPSSPYVIVCGGVK
mmetsp:Transcript_39823/g.127337  ORF Transcript_39823/g.127337 Transcript_39823/m.127337 type:complete len:222 (+) Transcript_39823:224-889(+)